MKLATSILLLVLTSTVISVVIAFVLDMILLNWQYLYHFLYGVATLFGSMSMLVLICIPKTELTWNMTSISVPDPADGSNSLPMTRTIPSPIAGCTSIVPQSVSCPYRYHPSPQPLVINVLGSSQTDTLVQVSFD